MTKKDEQYNNQEGVIEIKFHGENTREDGDKQGNPRDHGRLTLECLVKEGAIIG